MSCAASTSTATGGNAPALTSALARSSRSVRRHSPVLWGPYGAPLISFACPCGGVSVWRRSSLPPWSPASCRTARWRVRRYPPPRRYSLPSHRCRRDPCTASTPRVARAPRRPQHPPPALPLRQRWRPWPLLVLLLRSSVAGVPTPPCSRPGAATLSSIRPSSPSSNDAWRHGARRVNRPIRAWAHQRLSH